jgi:hypothetical protein
MAVAVLLLMPFAPQPIFLTGVVVVALLASKIATTPQPDDIGRMSA